MSDRMSPAFPCICGIEDWSYDRNHARWICNQCIRAGRPIPKRPAFDETFDFGTWHKSVMDDWDTIRQALAVFEAKPESDNPRDRLLTQARRRKIEEEYQRCSDMAFAADNIKWLKDLSTEGDIYVKLPSLDTELRITW